MLDLIIIGSGPAGLTASIYAKRAGIGALVLEEAASSGGQIINTSEIDNYPALPGINGFDLAMKMREHADKMGCEIRTDSVVGMERTEEGNWRVSGKKGSYEAKTVIVATGAAHRPLGVPGEKELAGLGVSYCAVCDGAFYRNMDTAVVGGGDAAAGDALYLARICRKVYLIHRRDQLRAAHSLQEKLKEYPNIEILWNTVVKEIQGEGGVDSLLLADARNPEKTRQIPVDGVFAAVGMNPNLSFAGDLLPRDASGYLIADEMGRTSLPGLFGAGDVRTKELRQIVTAVADGANAVASVEKYLSEN